MKKVVKKTEVKKEPVSKLHKLLMNGPTWTEAQYKKWLKDSKKLHTWQIK